RRALAGCAGAHDRRGTGPYRHRRTRPPGGPRVAGCNAHAAQLRRPRRRAGAHRRRPAMINEFRRAKRRKAADTILVMDGMTERVVGRIGNLSETGMLLLANEALVDDALYQLRFTLPTPEGADVSVEVGAH